MGRSTGLRADTCGWGPIDRASRGWTVQHGAFTLLFRDDGDYEKALDALAAKAQRKIRDLEARWRREAGGAGPGAKGHPRVAEPPPQDANGSTPTNPAIRILAIGLMLSAGGSCSPRASGSNRFTLRRRS